MRCSTFMMSRHCRSFPGKVAASALLAAAGIGLNPASAQSEASFSGFKIEAITGYDDAGVDFEDNVFEELDQQSQSGWLYGLGIGYDLQNGPWVFGAEAEWSNSTASRDESLTGVRPANPIAGVPVPIATELEGKAGSDIYIGARTGYAVSPTALLYVKGGWSFSKIKFEGEGTDGGVPFTFDESASMDGFRIGAGGEIMFTDSIYGKAEYRYTKYSNGDLDINGADFEPLVNGTNVDRHQFVVGAGLRF